MGEGANRVNPDDAQTPYVQEIAGEIDTLRNELGDLVGELERRRHEVFNLRVQLRRHPLAAGLAGLTVAAAIGGAIAFVVWKRRRHERPLERAREIRRALGRILDEPHRVAREPSIGVKIATAAGSAAATALAKRLVQRAVRPAHTSE